MFEVGGPAPQHPVEPVQKDFQRQVRVLPAHCLYLGHDRTQCFLGWVGVDIVFRGASFPVTLDTPAEEIEALVDVGDQCLLRGQA